MKRVGSPRTQLARLRAAHARVPIAPPLSSLCVTTFCRRPRPPTAPRPPRPANRPNHRRRSPTTQAQRDPPPSAPCQSSRLLSPILKCILCTYNCAFPCLGVRVLRKRCMHDKSPPVSCCAVASGKSRLLIALRNYLPPDCLPFFLPIIAVQENDAPARSCAEFISTT